VRRLVLACSTASFFLLPLWHLKSIDGDRVLGGGSRFGPLAQQLPLPAEAPPILGVPWSLQLWGLEFLDPLAAAGLFVAGRGGWLILLGVLPTFALVALLGRFFCGWLCPYVPILAASQALRSLLAKIGVKTGDRTLPAKTPFWILLGLLIFTAVFGSQIAPLFYPPAVFGRQLFRATFFGAMGSGALLIAAAFVLDTTVSKAGFCRYLCPGGALFRVIGLASPIRVKRTVSKCTNCTACDVVCNLAQRPMIDALDSGCERCGKCIASCPTKALEFSVGSPKLVLIHDRQEGT
jgi:ferredoxin-type protein NapH